MNDYGAIGLIPFWAQGHVVDTTVGRGTIVNVSAGHDWIDNA